MQINKYYYYYYYLENSPKKARALIGQGWFTLATEATEAES